MKRIIKVNVQVGDIIMVDGFEPVTIQHIIEDASYLDDIDITFFDTYGKLRRYRNFIDGGYIYRNIKLTDCYGVDVTDIFEKYGY